MSTLPPALSIILPVLNEAPLIVQSLQRLAPLRAQGAEIIVVDGGSWDGTARLATPLCDQVLEAPCGRARQMNAGARCAQGKVLLFLHADTTLPPDAVQLVSEAVATQRMWGRFDVLLEGRHPLLRLVAWSMNLRSRLTGIATGDQAMFVVRAVFERCGGFPPIPLMEDIALSRRLRYESLPACLRAWAITSARRWEHHGVVRTIVLMWWLRLAYYFGADPAHLAQRYGYGPTYD